jgi:hypothetical protein
VIPRVEELLWPELEGLPAADVLIEQTPELIEVIDVQLDVEPTARDMSHSNSGAMSLNAASTSPRLKAA